MTLAQATLARSDRAALEEHDFHWRAAVRDRLASMELRRKEWSEALALSGSATSAISSSPIGSAPRWREFEATIWRVATMTPCW